MSAVDVKFYEKKKSQTFYVALSLLLLVLLLTWGLYYYSYTLKNKILENESNLAQVETSISQIQQDEKIQIYSTYAQNKILFSRLSEVSKIPSMIRHLKRVFSIGGVSYEGFSYSEWNAQINLSLETTDSWYAYEKVIKFLSNYRANEDALFTIDQISSFSWYDRMNFSADLTLKTQ